MRAGHHRLGPAFAAYPAAVPGQLPPGPDAGHFDTYCRAAVRLHARASSRSPSVPGRPSAPSREFLVTARWDQPPPGTPSRTPPGSSPTSDRPARTVGVIDRDECRKWATARGVQRPVPGCVGKIDQRHRPGPPRVAKGTFQAPSWTPTCSSPSVVRGPPAVPPPPASRTTSGTARSGGWRWTSAGG